MRAAVISGYGGPEVFSIAEVPDPELRANDVLIEVYAAAVNPVDTKIRKGVQRVVNPRKFPSVLGMDVSGVVKAVGPAVTRFKVGDAVYASPSHKRPGTYAELVAVDADEAALKPASLTHQEAASLPLVALTTLNSLIKGTSLQAGETVLIHAGSGGVGTIAIQYAKHLGAKVVTTCSARNRELVEGLGADIVVDYTKQDFAADSPPADVVIDAIGGEVQARSLGHLAPGGRLSALVTGLVEVQDRFGPYFGLLVLGATLAWRKLGARLRGRRFHIALREASGTQLEHITALVETGTIRPVVDKVFPLAEIAEAHRYIETGRARGKIVIDVRTQA